MRFRSLALAGLLVLGLTACSTPTADKAELAKTVGATLQANANATQAPEVVCPNALKLKENEQTICTLTNPSDGNKYDVTVTYQGQTEQQTPIYDIQVANTPQKTQS